jgi:Fic family protein
MVDPRVADAAYRSFPTFEEWAKNRVDTQRWDRYSELLAIRGAASPQPLRQAQEVVKRAAAVDTGAIEGLYEVDRGFTFTVATQAATWEAVLDARGPKTRALIESQLRAYEYVLDAATRSQPITEMWIRSLHEELCRSQETYPVTTEVGIQTHALPVGKYKHLPNHVQKQDGGVHSYAPVDLVPAEMHRLVATLRSEDFAAAHPVLQASYAHYAFVLIHPFADGNGRVARALASIFTYRSHSVPLLILSDNREAYLAALETADRGDPQAFVDFIFERAVDAIVLVRESLEAVGAPQAAEARAALDALYQTQGGYTQEEVDEAAWSMVDLLREELGQQAAEVSDPKRLRVTVGSSGGVPPGNRLGTRVPVRPESPYPHLHLHAGFPADVSVGFTIVPVVPLDAGVEDDIEIVSVENGFRRIFSARMSELRPHPTVALRMRLRIAAERILGEVITELGTLVRKKIARSS